MFALAALLASLATASARADGWDGAITLQSRSYPLGAIFAGQLGYGATLWRATPGKHWMYGYVRPALLVDSIGVVNRAGAMIELFPVSIVGVRAGQLWSFRPTSLWVNFDCAQMTCPGITSRQFVEAQLVLGWREIYAVSQARWSWLRQLGVDGLSADEMLTVPFVGAGDQSLQLTQFVGYRINPIWGAGIYAMSAQMLGSRAIHHHLMGYGQWTEGPWAVLLGLGASHSSINPLGFSAVLVARWNPVTPLGLF